MQIDKDQVIDLIKQKGGDHQKAQQELPDKVDTDQHSDVLSKHGIGTEEIAGKIGGIGGLG